MYRQVNTAKPKGPSDDERHIIDELKEEFVRANSRLANEFGLDLGNWY
jgi:hypothetical protein